MSERKYYVICGNNCKFESMTKEQIITAIQEAVSTGEIKDIDAGFITKVKEQNAGNNLLFWVGTTAEYNALEEKDPNCFYIKTDDTTDADIKATLDYLNEIAAQSIGKIPPQAEIIVTPICENVYNAKFTCKDEYGTEIKPSKKVATKWVFPAPRYGTYTITGVYNDVERTQTVEITAVKQYPLDFAFYADNFGNNDWETILALCKNNAVPVTWSVGTGKDITLTDGTVITAQIVGKSHDEDTNGNKCPLTLMFTDGQRKSMHYASQTVKWTATTMYAITLPSILAKFPTEIKNAIRTVKKYTSAGDSSATLELSTNTLFLMSEVERFGTNNYSVSGEGEQYSYFKVGNKLNENTWSRSPYRGNASTYCVLTGSGVLNPLNLVEITDTYYYYILFCL